MKRAVSHTICSGGGLRKFNPKEFKLKVMQHNLFFNGITVAATWGID